MVLHTHTLSLSPYCYDSLLSAPWTPFLQNKSAGWQLESSWLMCSKSVWRDPTLMKAAVSLAWLRPVPLIQAKFYYYSVVFLIWNPMQCIQHADDTHTDLCLFQTVNKIDETVIIYFCCLINFIVLLILNKRPEVGVVDALNITVVQSDLKNQWDWAFQHCILDLLFYFFLEQSVFCSKTLSSVQWQGGTNQGFVLTRQIHTLSHPSFPNYRKSHLEWHH